jgi:hypothetical protein
MVKYDFIVTPWLRLTKIPRTKHQEPNKTPSSKGQKPNKIQNPRIKNRRLFFCDWNLFES